MTVSAMSVITTAQMTQIIQKYFRNVSISTPALGAKPLLPVTSFQTQVLPEALTRLYTIMRYNPYYPPPNTHVTPEKSTCLNWYGNDATGQPYGKICFKITADGEQEIAAWYPANEKDVLDWLHLYLPLISSQSTNEMALAIRAIRESTDRILEIYQKIASITPPAPA